MQQENKTGFTLIEMLVVVLIIGILGAIGITKYQRVLLKTKFELSKTIVVTIAKASEEYFLTNGIYPCDLRKLSISLPDEGTLSPNGSKFTHDNIEYSLLNGYVTGPLATYVKNRHIFYIGYPGAMTHSTNAGSVVCAPGDISATNPYAKICAEACDKEVSLSWCSITKLFPKQSASVSSLQETCS